MKTPGYHEAPQEVMQFDDLVETAMRPYTLGELRAMRDDLGELLRKAAPTTKAAVDHLIQCAPRQEAAAFTALMAVTTGKPALRRRLGVLRTLSRYIHARELAASPGSRDLPPPPNLPAPPEQPSLPCLSPSEPQTPTP